jgi:large repetitive protein
MQKLKKKLSWLVLAALLLQLFSPITSALAASIPTAPTNVRFSLDGIDNVILRWDAVSGASVYRVYEIIGEEKVQISQTSNLNRYFPSVSGGNHTYGITAVNSAGESQLSTTIDVVIKYPDMQPPNGITSTILNGNDVSLKWNAVEFANGYKIYEVKNGQRELIATSPTVSKTFTNVAEGQHEYALTSYNDKYGESKASSLFVNVVYPIMTGPEGLTSYIYDVNNTTLSWKEVPFAESYNIYKIVNGERKFVATTVNIRQYIANLPDGENVFEVTSYSSRFGESKEGSKITVTIHYPEMMPPDQINSYFYNGNDLFLSWSSVKYATNYKVYQINGGQKDLIATTTSRSHYFSNLPEGDYTFEIVTVSDRFGESAPKAYDVTVDFPEMQAPRAILNMDTANSAIISWSSVPYANEYELYKLIDGQPTLIGTTTKTGYIVKDLEQGKHEYTVVAKSDRFGKSGYSNIVVAEVVPVLPAPEASKPDVKDDSINLSWKPVEDAASYNVYKEVDGERVFVGTTKDPNYTVETPEEEGTHEYLIVPVTEDGTESIDYATVTVEIEKASDVTPPVTTAETNLEWSKEDVAVTLSATDDLSGVKSTYYSINGTDFVEGTSVTLDKQGMHTVSFYSVDNAGNVEEVKSVDVKVDKEAPKTVINTSAYWYNKDVNVELTASDNLSGVKATYYSVNGSEFAEGTNFALEEEGVHRVSFYSVDNVGNVEEVRTVEVKIDKEAPKTTASTTGDWYNQNVVIELTAVDNLSGVHSTYYSVNGSEFQEGTSIVLDKEGVNTITFYSIDNAGNIEEKQTVEIKVDENAPVTVSNLEDKWYTDTVNVELTATDDLSGVKATYNSINGSEFAEGTGFVLDQEGINQVTFYSVDNAENIEEKQTVEVKVDATAPTTVTNVEDKWYTDGVNVELAATDNLSGVKATYYSINGSEFAEGTSFDVEKEGIHTVSFYSVDTAGNVEVTKTETVKIDQTAPTITEDFAKDYALGTVLDLNYQAADNLSGIKETLVEVNGVVNTTGKVTLDKPGVYTIQITAIDNAGLKTTVTKTVSVYIKATIEVLPKVINSNKGVFTVQVSLPKSISFANVDLSTAEINGVQANNDSKGLENQAKKGQFKFNREDFVWDEKQEYLEFRVIVDGYLVVGSTTVKVIK